jgi:hypothetical protein
MRAGTLLASNRAASTSSSVLRFMLLTAGDLQEATVVIHRVPLGVEDDAE